jgi:hypothetical protein
VSTPVRVASLRTYVTLAVDCEQALVGNGSIGLLDDPRNAAIAPMTGSTGTHQRRAAAESILNRLRQWIAQERSRLVDQSPSARALNYLIDRAIREHYSTVRAAEASRHRRYDSCRSTPRSTTRRNSARRQADCFASLSAQRIAQCDQPDTGSLRSGRRRANAS